MKITKSFFGKTNEGQDVDLFTLVNDHQITIKITNYGGIITTIETPDKNGQIDNIACGFEQLASYLDPAYLANYPYFGALCGRVSNRIAKGQFSLDGKQYTLAVNNGANHLHGGLIGFDRKLFSAEMIQDDERVAVKLSALSPDMEEGYPGNLRISCTYSLNNANELRLEYAAETDQTTLINLTNHSYFNLTGGKEQIFNHDLQLNAKNYTESTDLIPTGKIATVQGTPYDFLEKKKLGRDINSLENGYDLNLVLDNNNGNLVNAGCLSEESSGRSVKVFTTQPGIQLYTGYWIPEIIIQGQRKFGSYAGVALETQHYPDSIHHANFPSVTLTPDELYSQTTIYKFGTI